MEIIKKIEEEVMEANDSLIDTILHVSIRSEKREGASESKDTVAVECTYRGICVEETLKEYLELSKMVPLCIIIPPDYPENPPAICPQSLPDNSHQIDLSARRKFERLVQNLREPVTIAGLGKLYDRCCRDAVIDVAMQFGGGTFSSNFGIWESSAM